MFERVKEDNSNSIKKATSVLESGGIIAYPTDTIYGFGCDAKNEEAIERLNRIKGRSAPMSVLCHRFQKFSSWKLKILLCEMSLLWHPVLEKI